MASISDGQCDNQETATVQVTDFILLEMGERELPRSDCTELYAGDWRSKLEVVCYDFRHRRCWNILPRYVVRLESAMSRQEYQDRDDSSPQRQPSQTLNHLAVAFALLRLSWLVSCIYVNTLESMLDKEILTRPFLQGSVSAFSFPSAFLPKTYPHQRLLGDPVAQI